MPVLHFGFWEELLEKWVSEGHLKQEAIINIYDGSPNDRAIGRKLVYCVN